MKLTEYREITARMCGEDIKDWYPDKNEHQRQKVEAVLYEMGYGIHKQEMVYEGTVLTAVADIINKRRGQIFAGSGKDLPEAYMNAFIDWHENLKDL